MKNPMISATGRKIDRMPRSQLLLGASNSYCTSCSSIRTRSASDTPVAPSPVVVYLSPLVNSPVILPDPLLMTAVEMFPSMTCSRHSEYSSDSPLSLGHRLGTRKAAATTPTRSQIVHFGQLPGPLPVPLDGWSP